MEGSWEKIKEFAKEHPYALGVIVFVVGAILVYLIFHKSSSSGATNSADPNSSYYAADAAAIQSGNQLYEDQMQLQAYSAAQGDALSAQTEQYASQEQIAQLGANVDTTQITANQESTDLANTLSASVESQQLTAQQQINQNNNATAVSLNSDNNSTILSELQATLAANTTEMQSQTQAFTSALNEQDLTQTVLATNQETTSDMQLQDVLSAMDPNYYRQVNPEYIFLPGAAAYPSLTPQQAAQATATVNAST